MATTQITLVSFQTICAECADAIESGDWATAYQKYAKAAAVHAALEVQVSDQATSLRRHETLNGLQKALDAAKAATSAGSGNSRFITTKTKF